MTGRTEAGRARGTCGFPVREAPLLSPLHPPPCSEYRVADGHLLPVGVDGLTLASLADYDVPFVRVEHGRDVAAREEQVVMPASRHGGLQVRVVMADNKQGAPGCYRFRETAVGLVSLRWRQVYELRRYQ